MFFLNPDNYEHTLLETVDFPFNCFEIFGSTTLPHWHNHTELIYINGGYCDVYVNGSLYSCASGDILLVPQSSLHSIVPKDDCHHFAIVIGKTLLEALGQDKHLSRIIEPILNNPSLNPIEIKSQHNSYDQLQSSINCMIFEFMHKLNNYESQIKLELSRLFLLLKRYDFIVSPNGYDKHIAPRTQTMKDTMTYLFSHYQNKITIPMMSHFMNLSDQHFSRLFKSYTGKTFTEYLTLLRLEQAHQLLVSTDLPITLIPELTGFCNPNYFSRVFKQYYGETPSSRRKTYTS